MSMQIYDQTSIQRNWSKVKLCCAVSLGLGIKGVKITRNVVKVGMHTRLSNGHPNLWSNLNFNKLVKSETGHLVSLGFGLKEAEITPNMAKVGIHSCLPNGHLNLWLNFNSEKLVKSEISSCGFAKVGLKGVENSLEHHKSWHACFCMKWASKSTITFQFQEIALKWNSGVWFPKCWV